MARGKKKVCAKGTRRVKFHGKIRCKTRGGKLKAPRAKRSYRRRKR